MEADKQPSVMVWQRIVRELARFQDVTPAALAGQVVNSISQTVCLQDTVCAGKVFAAEYRRTGEDQWAARARTALQSIRGVNLYVGLPEPVWDKSTSSWRENAGSMFITGSVLDTVWEAQRLLGETIPGESVEALLDYIVRCRIGPGLFAHDAVLPGNRPPGVQNIVAISLFLMERIHGMVSWRDHPLMREREEALHQLCVGQQADGLWPYRCAAWRADEKGFVERDTMHHCLVLHYLAKIALMRADREWHGTITRGWRWIADHLKTDPEGGMQVDWSWEPMPVVPRGCNYRDTNTYFLILAILPLLFRLHVLDRIEAEQTANGLLKHIEVHLITDEGNFPGITPLEGPPEITGKVFPMVEAGVAWKGALLADWILWEI